METDNIHTGAAPALMRGIKKAADLIAGTLGPTGYSLIIEDELRPGHMVADDGWVALRRIKLADPLEQRGVELLKEAVEKANKESGDGSTTTTIITAKILEEGLKITDQLQGAAVKRELDACLPIIEKAIADQTTPVGPDQVAAVATVASGDKEIGTLLQEIYTTIGKDGIVELDNSGTPFTSYDIVEGVRLHGAGFLHELMTNDGQGKKATIEKPKILIVRQTINSAKEIDPLLKSLMSGGDTSLVIFYKEIADPVLQYMAEAHVKGLFKFLLIKAPTLWQDWLFEDFAKITGATIIDPTMGTSMAGLQLHYLGTCDKIIAHKNETLVIGTKDISAHIAKLTEAGKADDQQLLRASWLNTKTAILKIGANSESELSLKRLKIEDARNAVYQALQGGVVKGAGLPLVLAAEEIEKVLSTPGSKIMIEGLKQPSRQLKINMGPTIDITGVVDPANVVLNAVKNAVSVAGTVLTAKGVITLPKP